MRAILGCYDDRWISVYAELDCEGGRELVFDFYLPPKKQARDIKKILVFVDGTQLEFSLKRGEICRVGPILASTPNGKLHRVRLEISEPEPETEGDLRVLGALLVEVRVDGKTSSIVN